MRRGRHASKKTSKQKRHPSSPESKLEDDSSVISAFGSEERTGGRVTRQTVADLDCGPQHDVRLSQALALADALGTKIEQQLLVPTLARAGG